MASPLRPSDNGRNGESGAGHPRPGSFPPLPHGPFSGNGDGHAEAPALITGGAGFIGTNLAARLAGQGRDVIIFDNLARPGVERNIAWLRGRFGRRIHHLNADIRDAVAVRQAVRQAGVVFHFAAQVAVTTSLVDPRDDFNVNALGTLNVLEALREQKQPAPLLFTSTNKVYGALDWLPLRREADRYRPVADTFCHCGVNEQMLDFHSPYGCSKGAADQYVLDYARSFGLRTVVFRMSCIYGLHQMGTEDQGWVAHFLISAIEGRPITLYGDGCQVRDVLFVDDLVDAMLLAIERLDQTQGKAFNIGGGPSQSVSLLELLDLMELLHEPMPELRFSDWRQGDQRYYVSDTSRFSQATGWKPRIGMGEGVRRLYQWLQQSPSQTMTSEPQARRRPA